MGRRPRKEIRREPGPGAKPDEWDGWAWELMSWKSKLANSVKSRRRSERIKDRKQIFVCDKQLTVGFLVQYQQTVARIRGNALIRED